MICMRLVNCPEWIWMRDRRLWHSNLWYRNQNLRCNADDNIFAWVNLDHYLICQLKRRKKYIIIDRGNKTIRYWLCFTKSNTSTSFRANSDYIFRTSFLPTAVPYISIDAVNTTSSYHWDIWKIKEKIYTFFSFWR